jgi:hypothetical protein
MCEVGNAVQCSAGSERVGGRLVAGAVDSLARMRGAPSSEEGGSGGVAGAVKTLLLALVLAQTSSRQPEREGIEGGRASCNRRDSTIALRRMR